MTDEPLIDPRTIDPVTYEDDIVWIHDPHDIDFVRVTTMGCFKFQLRTRLHPVS